MLLMQGGFRYSLEQELPISSVLIVLIFAVIVCYLLHPAAKRCRGIEHYAPTLIENEVEQKEKQGQRSIADKLENNRWLALIMIMLMVGAMVY